MLAMLPAAAPVSIFLSYSHKDEKWKNRLVAQLQVLEKAGRLSLWEDRLIKGGDEWLATISGALDDVDVAILMVSAHSLTSEFILRNEVPRLLESPGYPWRIRLLVDSCHALFACLQARRYRLLTLFMIGLPSKEQRPIVKGEGL